MSRRRRSKRRQKSGLPFGWLLSRRTVAVSLATVALLTVALVGVLLLRNLSSGGGPSPVPKAAIVDQVSVYDANPEFIAAATELLKGAGYAVDYYPGEEVTVGFYRELPTHGYDLIVLRSHSSVLREAWAGEELNEVAIYTSEPYSPGEWYEDQKAQRLAKVRYHEDGEEYFGIRAEFVRTGMEGDFEDATIILMGCDGLTSEATAEAFVERGAKSFVSWTDAITWEHSDAATERLLRHLLIDKVTTVEAAARTMAELGPDPVFGAYLRILTRGG
jgi:hypothetical protein